VQTLVGQSVLDIPRRVTSGLDGSRVGMVLAVLQRHADIRLGKQDVYAATVGGVRLTEPSVDLAMALALASSTANLSLPAGVVAIGEVGLAGEVRRVTGVARRLAEAERMGFRRAIVPAGSGGLPSSAQPPSPRPGDRKSHLAAVPSEGLKGLMDVREVEDVRHAIAAAMGD
jgi:DNA repair protein RadA/Sms